MDDLFGGTGGDGGGTLPGRTSHGGLRGEAAAALAEAKSRLRRFGGDWHAVHGLAAALRDPRVRFVPSSGEPEIRRVLEAVVSAARGAAALGPAAFARLGVDASAIAAAGRDAEEALRSLRGIVVTYGQVADALEGRRGGGREADLWIARVRRELRLADRGELHAEPDGRDADAAPAPRP